MSLDKAKLLEAGLNEEEADELMSDCRCSCGHLEAFHRSEDYLSWCVIPNCGCSTNGE